MSVSGRRYTASRMRRPLRPAPAQYRAQGQLRPQPCRQRRPAAAVLEQLRQLSAGSARSDGGVTHTQASNSGASVAAMLFSPYPSKTPTRATRFESGEVVLKTFAQGGRALRIVSPVEHKPRIIRVQHLKSCRPCNGIKPRLHCLIVDIPPQLAQNGYRFEHRCGIVQLMLAEKRNGVACTAIRKHLTVDRVKLNAYIVKVGEHKARRSSRGTHRARPPSFRQTADT